MQDNSRPQRERRQREAQIRQEAFDKLTPEQKLELLTTRPGKSAKERARLEAQA